MKDFKLLIQKAYIGQKTSYAPYSHFPVGAAVLADDGCIYTGCNIENASYGAGICAERTAIFKAVSAGCRRIKEIAIVGPEGRYTYPCGICRQVLAEFAGADTPVILAKNPDEYIVRTLGELLPGAFTSESLTSSDKIISTGDNHEKI